MNKNIAYLLGALRDATLDIRKGKNYEIKIAQKNKKWLQVVQGIFKVEFGKEGNILKHMKGYWILRINGREITRKLKEISEIKIPQRNWKTPSQIKSSNIETKINYIKGFFDSEGGLPKKINRKSQKYIIFSQENKESLEFIRETLMEIGIRPTNLTTCGGVWEFRITTRDGILKFIDNIGSSHPEKIGRLKFLK
jgi:intein-encoded DNA endonuclease-like protein